jgi:cell division protein ZapE
MFKFFFSQIDPPPSHPQYDSELLQKKYQELVVKHHLQNDAGQIKILGHLQQLLTLISEQVDLDSQTIVSKFISTPQKTTKSLYIFGEVGRGKSMLMEVFFDACPINSKRRIHFHAFMQEVHEYMHQWRKENQGDPLPSLAEKIAKESVVLCFDEFHVTDIADAMILSRLFTRLFNLGVFFVATSNQHPDDLYKNGLQRALFLPFIALLKQSADIVELVAKEDYRLSHLKAMKTMFYSKAEGKDDFIQTSFNELTNDGSVESKMLKYKGRELVFAKVHGDILLSSFDELCARALGPVDYLKVANEFSTILIADIPLLSIEIRDQVRRFVTLIDALYEQNVKLICSAAVSADQLTFKDKNFDFKRTRSRLIEMQSEQYLQRQHLV